MADKSKIEWTDATWNPIVGCSVVSPGCTNCYAMAMADRIRRMAGESSPYFGLTRIVNGKPVWTGDTREAPEHILTAPLRWKRPRRIFVNSMGDLFHESVPDAAIDKVFAVMALAPRHTFQVLTKRSKRMREYFAGFDQNGQIARAMKVVARHLPWGSCALASDRHFVWNGGYLVGVRWPLPNVWLGVSAERQLDADERIPELLATPAAVRFVSAEPLLGPIDFTQIDLGGSLSNTLQSTRWITDTGIHDRSPLDWIIVGGESGPGARPLHPDWARSIRDSCAEAGAPFFFKQWGEHLPGELAADATQENPWRRYQDGRVLIPLAEYGKPLNSLERVDFYRVGKRAAGRLLDGVEHDAFPTRKETP